MYRARRFGKCLYCHLLVTGIRHSSVFSRAPEAESASEVLCVKRTKDNSPQDFYIMTIKLLFFFVGGRGELVRAYISAEVTNFALKYIVMIFDVKNCLSLCFR